MRFLGCEPWTGTLPHPLLCVNSEEFTVGKEYAIWHSQMKDTIEHSVKPMSSVFTIRKFSNSLSIYHHQLTCLTIVCLVYNKQPVPLTLPSRTSSSSSQKRSTASRVSRSMHTLYLTSASEPSGTSSAACRKPRACVRQSTRLLHRAARESQVQRRSPVLRARRVVRERVSVLRLAGVETGVWMGVRI